MVYMANRRGGIKRFLPGSDIKAAIDMKEAMDALENAFMIHSEGRTKTPVRTHLDLEAVTGIGLFMSSWVEMFLSCRQDY